jgi:hypothetical protein
MLFEAKMDTHGFRLVRELGGSTGAALYEDGKGGKWVVKFGANVEHMWSEYTANKIYKNYGIKVPEAYIGEIDGNKALITKYLEGSVPLGDVVDVNSIGKLEKGFIFDVITANWDVVGTTFDLDNIRVLDGEVYRVDVGGSLAYRAQGAPKGSRFGVTPSEHETLRDYDINHVTATLFTNISDKFIADALREAAKEFIVDGKFKHIAFLKKIRSVIYDEDSEMSDADKKHLYKTLSKRAINLYRLFN